MNKVKSIFELGYVRMDGVWFKRDLAPYPGGIVGKEPDVVEYLVREDYSILYHEGRVYLKKADPTDLDALKRMNVVPKDLEAKRLGDGPGWLPNSRVKYASEHIFARFTEASQCTTDRRV